MNIVEMDSALNVQFSLDTHGPATIRYVKLTSGEIMTLRERATLANSSLILVDQIPIGDPSLQKEPFSAARIELRWNDAHTKMLEEVIGSLPKEVPLPLSAQLDRFSKDVKNTTGAVVVSDGDVFFYQKTIPQFTLHRHGKVMSWAGDGSDFALRKEFFVGNTGGLLRQFGDAFFRTNLTSSGPRDPLYIEKVIGDIQFPPHSPAHAIGLRILSGMRLKTMDQDAIAFAYSADSLRECLGIYGGLTNNPPDLLTPYFKIETISSSDELMSA